MKVLIIIIFFFNLLFAQKQDSNVNELLYEYTNENLIRKLVVENSKYTNEYYVRGTSISYVPDTGKYYDIKFQKTNFVLPDSNLVIYQFYTDGEHKSFWDSTYSENVIQSHGKFFPSECETIKIFFF